MVESRFSSGLGTDESQHFTYLKIATSQSWSASSHPMYIEGIDQPTRAPTDTHDHR
jgi:hypothetical protein